MSEVGNLLDELKRIQEGDAWHGLALREILAGVTAEKAGRTANGSHSIWELVLHISAWEEVFCDRLEGHQRNEPEEGDFPPVRKASEEGWNQVLYNLEESHSRLIRTVSRLTDGDLNRTVVGKDYTIGFMLHGIVRHHVYHAGQIGLLNRLQIV